MKRTLKTVASFHLLFFIAAIFILPSCTQPTEQPSAEGVLEILNGDFTIGKGQSVQLIWQTEPNPNETVSWSIEPSGSASVSTNGRLTAITVGSTRITAQTESGLKDSILVTITEAPPVPESIFLNNTVYKRIFSEEFNSTAVKMEGAAGDSYSIENGRLLLRNGGENSAQPEMKLSLTVPAAFDLIRLTFRTGDNYSPRFGLEENGTVFNLFAVSETTSGVKNPVMGDGTQETAAFDFPDEMKQRFVTLDVARCGRTIQAALNGSARPQAYWTDDAAKEPFSESVTLVFGAQEALTDAPVEYASLASIAFYQADEVKPSIIPQPKTLKIDTDGFFTITEETALIDRSGTDISKAVDFFKNHLSRSIGISLPSSETADGGSIALTADSSFASEAYALTVTADGIEIRAGEYAGFFYGLVTLLQMLPPEVFSKTAVGNPPALTVPFASVEDAPRFEYRGFMLDESRTFFGKETVLNLLDQLAYLKYNRFHWHLTDNAGIRFPFSDSFTTTEGNTYNFDEFMKKAAWRKGELGSTHTPEWIFCTEAEADRMRYHDGVYTVGELKEIIAYAEERNIVIIPEFDIPGHCKPIYNLLVSDTGKSLRCDGFYRNTIRGGQIFQENGRDSDLCPSLPDTYEVLAEMFGQMIAVFGSEMINIGGDEVRIADPQLGNGPWWYCKRCEDKIKAHGWGDVSSESMHQLQSLFFDEFRQQLETEFPDTNLMMWSEAVTMGDVFRTDENDLIADWSASWSASYSDSDKLYTMNTPLVNAFNGNYYLSVVQSREDRDASASHRIGAIWAVSPTEKVYNADPVKNNSGVIPSELLVGVQTSYWSDYCKGFSKDGVTYTPEMHMVYMCFPRAAAVAERAWSPESEKNYSRFIEKLQNHFSIYEYSKWDGVCQDERIFYLE